jgi:amino acid adenylation domain-containing protein
MQVVTYSDAALAVHREINATAQPYPRDSSMAERFELHVRRRPDAPAVVQGDRGLTYRELNRYANGLAHDLQGEGVGLGTTVGVCMARSPEMLVALVGVLKCGGTYVPIDPDWPEERLRYVVADAGCPLVLTDRPLSLAGQLERSGCRVLPVSERTLVGRDADPACPAGGESIACINFTSGSSGRPKGVPILHRGINRLLYNATYVPLDERSRVLQITPFTFDVATWEIWTALLNGGVSVMYPAEFVRLSTLRRVVRAGDVNLTLLTAALFNSVVDEAPEALETVETITTGGEAASMWHIAKALRAYGPGRLIQVYGPTECTIIATTSAIDELPTDGEPLPIGRPIQNTQVYLLADDAQRLCEPGERGEICLAGDGLATGYLNLPDLTRTKFVYRDIAGVEERLYRTGDLGYLLPSGEAVFEGRSDDQVKVNSFRIELGEINHHLSRHPSVKQSYVTVRDDHAGRSLVAFVLPADDSASPEDLRDHLATKLPRYMVPAQIHLCDAFPQTPNGKIDGRALLSTYHPSATSGAFTQ